MRWRLRKDRMLASGTVHKAGTVVYHYDGYDFGLMQDDTRATGKLHTVVTLDSNHGLPFFTVPVADLEELDE